ncbi:hypothetical protein DNH61_10415 [Paenibacillus sambharensis]|uniref:Uncharacterized protein n=1 Tax=Paenibacillus sambharensis TaxID=1803190 RepID=A0A2W1LLV5_9BACL|nr:hypothetical protein [Paenibacillus sambharensis]PZD95855.1 hypothetical protein DNH61_10415 [Paenibacillus sambharensis]
MLSIKNRSVIVIYTIRASSIRNFLLVDLAAGTGIYLAVKMLSSNVWIASVGSMAGTEGLKRLVKLLAK